jgi:anti-anti-sigma factor
MKIKTQDYNDVTVIELHGELGSEIVESLRDTISNIIQSSFSRNSNQDTLNIAAPRTGIVIDMSKVGFVDSAALECLLWARDYCDENNCQLRLAGLDENCRKILEITRLESEFSCYLELSEAVKSLT